MLSLALLLCATALPGQQLIWQRTGVREVSSLGRNSNTVGGQIANVGDVDGDGCDDLLVLGGHLPSYSSQLWFLSGRDGHTIRTVRHGIPLSYQYRIARAGNVNADGALDYLVTIRPQIGNEPTRVEARSGIDDAVLWSAARSFSDNFGAALLGDIDLDGDGRSDAVATAPGVRNGGQNGAVFAFGSDGTPLWEVIGTPEKPIGMLADWNALGRVGDVNGDGIDDVVVVGFDIPSFAGAAIVLSGRTGQELVRGIGPQDSLLWAVDGCGDLDCDGVPDFTAGSYSSNAAFAFSGRTGGVLYDWSSVTLGNGIKSGGIDLDADGVPDIVASAPSEDVEPSGNRGAVYVFSGRDGSVAVRVERPPEQFGSRFGWAVETLRAQPGSPFGLFVVSDAEHGVYGSQQFGTGYLGKIAVYRAALPSVQPLGKPCAGALAQPPRFGMRGLGAKATSGARMHLSNAPPGANAALLIGLSESGRFRLPADLAGGGGFPGCQLHTSADVAVCVVTGTTGVDRGYAHVDVPVPLVAGGAMALYGQWLVLGSVASGGVSNAFTWRH
jgi:hypothetical protein